MNGQQRPAGYPISVKGVVVRAGRVLLLKNERDEWELPGGRLEAGETPEQCLVREIAEETTWKVIIGPLLDVWMYDIVRDASGWGVGEPCARGAIAPPQSRPRYQVRARSR